MGGRRNYYVVVPLVTGVLLVAAAQRPSDAHVVLDGEIVQAILTDVAKFLKETKAGTTEEAKLEALYSLGETTQNLVDLMNLDVMSHGKSLYAELIVKRLREYGIAIAFVERKRRFLYDLAAFKEYLKRSPGGRRAADAGFRLIAESFYRSIGTDAAQMVDLDVDGLRSSILQKEAFLQKYPQYDKIREVRFLLAMDYYRLHKNSPDPATAKRYEKLSAQALQEIVKEYPGTAEARAAEVTLGTLWRPGQKN